MSASNIESEMKHLEELRIKQTSVNSAIAKARTEIIDCHRQIRDARISAVTDPEANPPKATEALCKKLESELKTAEALVAKLTPEAEVLSGAVARIESEIVPRRHAERLAKQNALRERYVAIATRMLESANALAALSAEAKSLYDGAHADIPKDEICDGQEVVRRFAGLAPVWDEQWINYGFGSRRDVVVNAVWQFERTLVDAEDPVARNNQHQEDFRRLEFERIERERNRHWSNRPLETERSPNHQRGVVRHPLGLPL
ncbi:MAG TPA: hypothetical protein VHW09_15755 [Bryobacteraceae bacterium]|jgi:hypothetical protein|nr:hypothetical protein [Bryobacteraceae bacterium]